MPCYARQLVRQYVLGDGQRMGGRWCASRAVDYPRVARGRLDAVAARQGVAVEASVHILDVVALTAPSR